MVGNHMAGYQSSPHGLSEAPPELYCGDMARPTAKAQHLAERLDVNPSTVQGWLERGFDPAPPLAPDAEAQHFQAVAGLLRPGRDGSVVTLKLAADGYGTRRLRDVLGQLHDSLAVEVSSADELLVAYAEAPPCAPMWPRLLAGAAGLLGDLELGDLTRIAGASLPSNLDQPNATFFNQLNAELLHHTNTATAASSAWLTQTADADLVNAVQNARRVVDALAVSEPTFKGIGDEEYWRLVGRLTSIAEYFLALISGMVGLLRSISALAPGADASRFLAAIDGTGTDNREEAPVHSDSNETEPST